IGKIWATVDFDRKIDGKKELIVTIGSYLKILNSDLNEIMSYNLNDNIKKVIVSDINNDGIIEIIASSATKTYILRPTTSNDLPNAPTNLKCERGINYVTISWNYVPNIAKLSGFKIYRGLNTSNLELVKVVENPNARTTTDTPPSEGHWYYKVSSFNDFGEVDCVNPPSYLIEYRQAIPEEEGGGCFIATICFGENSWQVKILKEFRDRILLKSNFGRKFVKFYYKVSPQISEYLKNHKFLILTTKILLYFVIIFIMLLMSEFLMYTFITGFIILLWIRKKGTNRRLKV
ncbi:MAG: CFI-box-CTERM domain-containing protein, partial [Candidatus Ratteibacteria bacterium]